MIIGKDISCDFRLDFPQISRKHAELTVIDEDGGIFLIEDLDSSNGTYVNDMRIKRATVNVQDKVKLANIRLDLQKFLKPKPPKPEPVTHEDIKAAFAELKFVYDEFEKSRFALIKGVQFKRTLVQASLAWIPFLGNPAAILINSKLDVSEKQAALEKQFRLNYVCPKCKNFLGMQPWESLELLGRCNYCKVPWK